MRFPSATLFLAAACLLAAPTPSEIAESIRKAELDPEECYRVRDLRFTRGGDLRFYLTEGYLIFGKPVAGRRISAVFSADTEGGDAEMIVMPPTRGERASLAEFAGSPNLNEHFRTALFLFTDDSVEALLKAIAAGGETRKSPERGLLLAAEWNSVLANISTSFSVRLVHHILGGVEPARGLFYAGLQGAKLGSFDAFHDPDLREQIYLGQLKYKDDRAYYDTWTSFPALAYRTGSRPNVPGDFTTPQFRISAALDPSLQLKVTTRATVVPRRDLNVFAFEITEGMRVSAARVNGEPAELFTRESLRANAIRRNESVLFLVLSPRLIKAGERCEVEVEHEGAVVRRAGSNVFYVGARSNWYPRHGVDFSKFDIEFRYPAHLQLVFPGAILSDQTEGDVRVTRRASAAPMRIAGFNLGQYESAKVTRGPLTVEVFANRQVEAALAPRAPMVVLPAPFPFPRRMGPPPRADVVQVPQPPPDPTERLDALAHEIAAGFEFLTSHLGPPAVNTLMVSPIPGAFGQGFPGLVYLSTLSYLRPQDRPVAVRGSATQLFFSELLHTHEVAHQWWGNLVTSAGPQDDWLMEALANYSSLLLLERKKGARALASVLEGYKDELLDKDDQGKTAESAGPIRLGTRLMSSQAALGAWHKIVYGKGTWVLHMLRKRMGDAAFLKLLGSICRDYRYQPLSVRRFQQLAAAALPKGAADPKLETFFEHWVDGTGIPEISMTTQLRGKAPVLRLAITLAQSGVSDQVTVQVPVEVQAVRGRSQIHWIATSSEPSTLTIPLRAPPFKVTLDPDSSVLAIRK